MEILSQCGLGAVLMSCDKYILAINETGDRLLHGGGNLMGGPIPEAAAPLFEESPVLYANIAFGEYLCRCGTPRFPDMPPDTQLVVFRSAANDACHDMLISVLNGLREAVFLLDAEGRIYFFNDAAVKMDSLAASDILGKHVSEVYYMQDGQPLGVPQVIKEKRPKLNLSQHYTTCFGKKVSIVSNIFPVIQNGQTLGAFNIAEDWSTVSDLHKQIIDLQNKLLKQSSVTRTKGTARKSTLTATHHFHDIIYISRVMNKLVERCQKIARSDSSVMIYGETGTGKELLAQSIHNASRRANGPFLAINCAAIPSSLLEGLLFGTEKGAYTGAESRAGLFEQAGGGTLLLDEINSMSITLQSKLLRVLQDQMIRRVGGVEEIHADVRVLSNINIPPYKAIEEHKLRQDLFYRLGVININIPPLRSHKEDIPLLVKNFIIHFNKTLEKNIRDIDGATLNFFNSYQWPGNVRELEHAIESAMNIMPDDRSIIMMEDIPEHILYPAVLLIDEDRKTQTEGGPFVDIPRETEDQRLRKALSDNDGNISRAARSLGMSRQNLQYRIKRYGINLEHL
jgi:arginine utilization regulatory protein